MRPRAVYPMRCCIACSAIIVPRHAEGVRRFQQRKYCSKPCQLEHQPHPKGIRRSEQRDPHRTWSSSKATALEVRVMRQLRWIGRLTYAALSRMFGRSYSAIWHACNGHTWTHLPMPWEVRS